MPWTATIIYQHIWRRNNFYYHELLFWPVYAIMPHMEDLKELVSRKAHMLGLDDIRFTDAGGSLSHACTEPVELHACLPEARSLIVLFAAYRPGGPVPDGRMPLSAYYPASHLAYNAARMLTEYLISQGARAIHVPSLPAKAAALRTGGFIGDNGFYFHTILGSLTCIQTILTDASLTPDKADTEGGCRHCGACAHACPSGAAGNVDRCLRRHLNGLVPEQLRGDVYQLLGCEKCQTICPLNHYKPQEPISFPLEALMDGSALPELKQLVGPNMARPMRIKSQAALFAANTKQYQMVPQLAELAGCGIEPAATHAAWALNRLQSEVKP
jgi:epoxyqueuosine reductase QueG